MQRGGCWQKLQKIQTTSILYCFQTGDPQFENTFQHDELSNSVTIPLTMNSAVFLFTILTMCTTSSWDQDTVFWTGETMLCLNYVAFIQTVKPYLRALFCSKISQSIAQILNALVLYIHLPYLFFSHSHSCVFIGQFSRSRATWSLQILKEYVTGGSGVRIQERFSGDLNIASFKFTNCGHQ